MSDHARRFPHLYPAASHEPTFAEIEAHEKGWEDTIIFNHLEEYEIPDTPANRAAYRERALDLYMSHQ